MEFGGLEAEDTPRLGREELPLQLGLVNAQRRCVCIVLLPLPPHLHGGHPMRASLAIQGARCLAGILVWGGATSPIAPAPGPPVPKTC